MKKNNYLVVVTTHADNEYRKQQLLLLLSHLYENKIDVCLVTHCDQYINEYTPLVKYIVYDSFNEFIEPHDFLNNSDLIDNSFNEYGHSTWWHIINNYKFELYFPMSPHSRPSTQSFKTGCIVAYNNHYEWVAAFDGDSLIPKNGFKQLIENKIEQLVRQNKHYFYYYRSDLGAMLGNIAISNVNQTMLNNKFMHTDWNSTSREWIKQWKLGFGESIITSLMYESCISIPIENEIYEIWGTYDIDDLHSSSSAVVRSNVLIHLFPHKQNNEINQLIFLIRSIVNDPVSIDYIKIYSKDKLYLKLDSYVVNNNSWYMHNIYPTKDEILYLEYRVMVNGVSQCITEQYNMNHIDNIYNFLLNVATIN
jgi:hypothetical protein